MASKAKKNGNPPELTHKKRCTCGNSWENGFLDLENIAPDDFGVKYPASTILFDVEAGEILFSLGLPDANVSADDMNALGAVLSRLFQARRVHLQVFQSAGEKVDPAFLGLSEPLQ